MIHFDDPGDCNDVFLSLISRTIAVRICGIELSVRPARVNPH